jgi:peroxiredoxin
MTGRWTIALALTVVLAACAASTAAGVKIGDPAPEWSGLPGVDDKEHSLADYSKPKLVVLAFICNHCPVAVAYEDRLIALTKEYEPKGVQVIAVNVNNIDADKLDKMKVRAEKKEFNFPYLYDASQKIGRDYGATCTPHVFVLDKDRKIAYMGAIDDNQNEKKVDKRYLASALDALLKREKPEKDVTQQFGCGIKYEDKKK